MTSALLLLPTQEELVQRLQHTASYSGQLLLLCGQRGSGKSTLSIALASALDDHNSALVLCPLHADAAEIRRKILVQLISSPIFDDEIPLMDTVMRIQSTLTKPLHIIIDDAHLLPKSLWAECILLSQMRCAGSNIAVTMAIDSQYLAKVMAELSQDMQQMLLPISIEPLPIAERDGLYQSLLLRSGCTPFIARNIIHQQLEKQTGTPEEVVELLNRAISEPEYAAKISAKTVKVAIVALSMLIFGIVVYVFLNSPLLKPHSELRLNQQLTATQQQQRDQANVFLAQYGKLFVKPLPKSQERFFLLERASDPVTTPALEQHALTAKNNSEIKQSQPINKHVAVSNESKLNNAVTINSQSAVIAKSTESMSAADGMQIKETKADKPRGYTLQLVSVVDKQSLASVTSKLVNENNVYIARYKNRYVILFGQFSSITEAQEQSKRLQAEFGMNEPWLRKWSDLSEYRIEQENR